MLAKIKRHTSEPWKWLKKKLVRAGRVWASPRILLAKIGWERNAITPTEVGRAAVRKTDKPAATFCSLGVIRRLFRPFK
jgi:hypothetical protein